MACIKSATLSPSLLLRALFEISEGEKSGKDHWQKHSSHAEVKQKHRAEHAWNWQSSRARASFERLASTSFSPSGSPQGPRAACRLLGASEDKARPGFGPICDRPASLKALWSPQGVPSRHVEGKGGLRCRCCRHLPTPPMVVLPDFTEGRTKAVQSAVSLGHRWSYSSLPGCRGCFGCSCAQALSSFGCTNLFFSLNCSRLPVPVVQSTDRVRSFPMSFYHSARLHHASDSSRSIASCIWPIALKLRRSKVHLLQCTLLR